VTEAFTTALIAELGKKTGVCWLRYDQPGGADLAADGADGSGRARAAWHVWYDDALHLVADGPEQPLPGIAEAGRVEVTMRSKENGGRLLTWVGRVSVVRPGEGAWEPVTDALVSDRLNLEDLGSAKDEWAAHSVVVRIDPTGDLLEERGPLPRVLHRRSRGRPDLS
jgi:hypothetical protein